MDRFLRGERQMGGRGEQRGGGCEETLFFCSLPLSFCPLSLLLLLLLSNHLLRPVSVDLPFLCHTNNQSYFHNQPHSPQHFPLLHCSPSLFYSRCGKNGLNESLPLFTAACVSRGISRNTAALITLQLPQTDTCIHTHSGGDVSTYYMIYRIWENATNSNFTCPQIAQVHSHRHLACRMIKVVTKNNSPFTVYNNPPQHIL